MIELRDAAGAWGYVLPPVSDHEDPQWTTGLTQEQTPHGVGWVDGSPRAGRARMAVRSYVGATNPVDSFERATSVLAALQTATGIRDTTMGTEYWIAQGILGEPKTTVYRGRTMRLVEVVLALRDPYLHATDDVPGGGITPPGTGGLYWEVMAWE